MTDRIETAKAQQSSAESPVTAAELIQFFQKNVSSFDKNGNGFVDEKELNSAKASGSYQDRDAQLLDILIKKRTTLEGVAPDELHTWRDNDGITRADMLFFEESVTTIKDLRNMADLAIRDFKKIDSNKDGFIDFNEFAAAASDPTRPENERKLLKDQARKFQDISSLSNDEWFSEDNGITMKDLQKIGKDIPQELFNPHLQTSSVHSCQKSFPGAQELLSVLERAQDTTRR